MLATKHNSCIYLSQSLSLSLRLYIHCSKKSVRNREISGLAIGGGIYTNYTYWSLYTILRIGKKVSLFDFMYVGNNCICRSCFAKQTPAKYHLDSQLIYEYTDLIQYQHKPEGLFKVKPKAEFDMKIT